MQRDARGRFSISPESLRGRILAARAERDAAWEHARVYERARSAAEASLAETMQRNGVMAAAIERLQTERDDAQAALKESAAALAEGQDKAKRWRDAIELLLAAMALGVAGLVVGAAYVAFHP